MEFLISIMIFLPLVGSIIHFFIDGYKRVEIGDKVLFLSSAISGIIGIVLAFLLTATPEFRTDFNWIGAYSINYSVFLNGLNFFPIILVSIVFPSLLLFERLSKKNNRGISSLLLILQTSLYGTICSGNIFLTFLFWSLVLIPIYFIVSIWGGEKSEKISNQFFISSIVANGFLLISFLMIYFAVDPHTFDLRSLVHPQVVSTIFPYGLPVIRIAFFLFLLSFLIRLPVFPFYGWFTQLAKTAPMSLLIAMIGCVLPVGFFQFGSLGFVLFPQEMIEYADVVSFIALLNIMVGSVCATGTEDFRRLLSYLALTACGVVLLGFSSLNGLGVTGSFFQIFAFGSSLCGLGLIFGIVLNRYADHAKLSVKSTPMMAVMSAIFICALVGFPLLGSFLGNSLIIMGNLTVRSYGVVFMGLGILVMIYSLFKMFRGTYLSVADGAEKFDVSRSEVKVLVPVLIAIILIGVYPKPAMEIIKPAIETLVSGVK